MTGGCDTRPLRLPAAIADVHQKEAWRRVPIAGRRTKPTIRANVLFTTAASPTFAIATI